MKKQIVGQVVRFTFDDGLEPLEFDCSKLHADNATYAVPFGMCHRLGDMAAIPRKQGDTIITVTEVMRRDAIAAGIAHYESSDQWEMRAAAAPKFNPAIAALAAKLGKSYDEAKAWLANGTLDELMA